MSEFERSLGDIARFAGDREEYLKVRSPGERWLTIDSAPKLVGREILGSAWSNGRMVREPFITFWSPTMQKFYANPTHWVPLPLPPI